MKEKEILLKIGKKFLPLFLLLCVFNNHLLADIDLSSGEKLFNKKCATCHKIDKKMTGPPLAGVTSKRSQEWIISWVKDNVALRKSGDPDAIAIYEEYNGSEMQVFRELSEKTTLTG